MREERKRDEMGGENTEKKVTRTKQSKREGRGRQSEKILHFFYPVSVKTEELFF